MIIVGLTGSIAMGKSTAANMLAKIKGVTVLCSDEIVHDLYENNAELIALVAARFPKAFDHKNRRIDRKKLGAEIGYDHEKWDELEALVHPFVVEAQQEFIRAQKRLGTDIVVLDIPLLFETGAEQRCDYTIVVTAPEFIQEQRIRQRQMSDEALDFVLARQMPDVEKRARADFVIQSGQGLDYTRRELENAIKEIKDRNGHESHCVPTCRH